jgi:NSS family neurotransmitter:Na+ symporter
MREKLSSRLGFIMLAAGSAVGLGNVWRFPYVVGENGGAAFVIVYLAFLAILGFPLLAVELGIGRGANKSLAAALGALAPARFSVFWRRFGALLASGCFILMIYYTDVCGWLLKYASDYATLSPPDGTTSFDNLTADWKTCAAFMLTVVFASSLVCLAGVVKGVERVTKWMMISLLALLVVLAVKSLTLPGASEGLEFYLKPDWAKFMENPLKSVFAAMGQAFFTLSLGIGSMTICASYIGEDHSLVKESFIIILIDTFVALLAGLVIFPACATYGVEYTSGPGLIFEALPRVFEKMPCGVLWGGAFFLFLALAALTTVIAVFECLIAGLMDIFALRRVSASLIVGIAVASLAMPCVLWDGVLKWEDFAVSQLWLPVGALVQAVFAVNGSIGWGWDKFRKSVSIGHGLKMPSFMKWHYVFIVPLLILIVLFSGFFQ